MSTSMPAKFHRSGQSRQGPLHFVSGKLPLGAQKPPARRAAQSISIRDPAVRAVHDTPNPANCSRLPGDGRHSQPLPPHLFRHQLLTYLTSKGRTDAQIQLISGHESKKSLEIYQHLSLESVDKAYQDAVQSGGHRRSFANRTIWALSCRPPSSPSSCP